VAALLPVLVLLAAAALYLSLLSTAQDPYGVGRLALAQFHRQYARGIPLSVRVADSALGWIGVCEGVALLDGERVPQAVLRPDGSLYLARFGAGHGLWIVETAVVRQGPAHQVRPAPLPPWRQLLPFGPDRPLLGSLR
jgi:hypothetical protein